MTSPSFEGARRDWPGIEVTLEAWSARVRHCAQAGGQRPEALFTSHLYLVEACLSGNALAAIRLDEMLQRLRAVAASIDSTADFVDEVLQTVRTRLLSGGGKPRLNEYKGRAPLDAWLRVTVLNTALSAKRHARLDRSVGDDPLLELVDLGPTPDDALGVAEAKRLASRVLLEALEKLSPRERRLLRQHYLDALTLEQVAEYHGVHRATVARWLATARQAMLDAVEEAAIGHPSIAWSTVFKRLTLSLYRLLDAKTL